MTPDAIRAMIGRILDSPEGADFDPSDIMADVLSVYIGEDVIAYIDRESERRWPATPVDPRDPSDLARERAEARAEE